MSLVRMYQRLPYPAKVAAATLRGIQLQRWRYGSETDELVVEALERERWPAERLATWQQERLAEMLDHAARHVPYYRDQWAARRARGDHAPVDDLGCWPALPKEAVRSNPRAFLADAFDPRHLFEDHTSGTTGTPLPVWLTRGAVRAWYALTEARLRRWNGVSRRDRWAILGGQLVVPAARRRPPFWVWNAAGRQLYLSVFHLSDETAAAYVTAMGAHRVRYLLGYPSALAALAGSIRRVGIPCPRLDVVLTNAEPLHDHQREIIEEVFACPVRNTYGVSEAVVAASECAHRRLHVWPDAGALELVDVAGVPVPTGEPGAVVSTGLLNPAMPLIRYQVGDTATLEPSECECGRSLPSLAAVEGRSDDLVITREGRRVGRLDGIFKADLPIREAQIIQDSLTAFTVLYVPVPEGAADSEGLIAERLRERVGPVDVSVQAVDAIPRTPNGKFAAVISKVENPC